MTTHNDAVCGCPDFRTSRRTFLKGVGAAAGAGVFTSLVGDVFTEAHGGAPKGGSVLVVLSLRGGSDGLSLVVPHGDPG
ncbi:MAG: twin-arginine translocation signal domain-containing protein, partial [Nocardioidaceae bacterium]|nr:twin-arginine translocation signal domain-containing protein [Nocardioidaceae bacterium]